jgi:5,10-methylenetetrahydromethanopterin reductase
MRIGVTIDGDGGLDDLVAVVADVAAQGLHTAWLPHPPSGERSRRTRRTAQRHQLFAADALIAAAVVAVQVPGIEIGTAVVPTFPRHPIALATQAQSIQEASGGRFVLGVGSSHAHVIEGMFGYRQDRPVAHMREYLGALVPLLTHGEVDVVGTMITARATIAQREDLPPPPVLVAALGPRMLQAAGGLADGTITWMTGVGAAVDHVVPTITAAAAEAGRPRPRVVVALPILVSDDPNAARARAERQFLVYRQLPFYQQALARSGASGPGDIALVGNEHAVAAELETLSQAGVTDVAATLFGDQTDRARTMAVLAEQAQTRRTPVAGPISPSLRG